MKTKAKKKNTSSSPKAAPARPSVDISHNSPTPHDPMPPWPFTKSDPRPVPYGKSKKPCRVLLMPGKVEYDPAMGYVEDRIRKIMAKGFEVTIVVPDFYRGVGEIMARRNGLDYLVINTDKPGATALPSTVTYTNVQVCRAARRKLLSACNLMYVLDSSPVFDAMMAEVENYQEVRVRVIPHLYKPRKSPAMKPIPELKVSKKSKVSKSSAPVEVPGGRTKMPKRKSSGSGYDSETKVFKPSYC